MEICVYYNTRSIAEQDVMTVIEQIGTESVIHIYKDNVEWPVTLQVETEVLDSEKSPRFRNELMRAMEAIFEKIRSIPAWKKVLVYRDVDLLEIARYDWFFAIYEQMHPIWALEQILGRFSPKTLVWVSSKDRVPQISAKDLKYELAQRGVRVLYFPLQSDPKGKKLLTENVQFWRRALSDVKAAAAQGLRSFLSRSAISLSRTTGCPTVLFVENFPNSAKVSASVARVLQEYDDLDYQFVATRSSVVDTVAGLRQLTLLSKITPPRVWFESVYQQLQVSYLAQVITREIISGEYAIWDGLAVLMGAEFSQAMAKWLRRAVVFCCQFGHLIETLQPEVVATTSMVGGFARAAIALAKKQGASTFLIQHGPPNLDEFETYVLQDKILVWGERDKRNWIRIGFQPDSITVTGSPKFDGLSALTKEHDAVNQPAPGVFRVTYFPSMSAGSTVSLGNSRRMLLTVLRAIEAMQDTKLVVKIKGGDEFPIINEIDETQFMQIVRDRDAVDVILESDVVIVSTSTVGFEACALDKPLVVLNFPGIQINGAYLEYEAALFAATEAELKVCLERIRDDEQAVEHLRIGRRKLVHEMFADLVPGAAKRIAAVIAMDAFRKAKDDRLALSYWQRSGFLLLHCGMWM